MSRARAEVVAEPSSASCTCIAVRRAARHVTQFYDLHLAPTGLRTTQYSLLHGIAAAGPLTLGGMAAQMGLDRTTLGRNLRPLEREGLVAITVDAADRRGRSLTITASGRERLAQARSFWRAAQAAFEARYGEAETRALHATLDGVSRLEMAPGG